MGSRRSSQRSLWTRNVFHVPSGFRSPLGFMRSSTQPSSPLSLIFSTFQLSTNTTGTDVLFVASNAAAEAVVSSETACSRSALVGRPWLLAIGMVSGKSRFSEDAGRLSGEASGATAVSDDGSGVSKVFCGRDDSIDAVAGDDITFGGRYPPDDVASRL